MNTDVLWPELEWAEMQVLRIQTKLHQWATDDPDRRFDDLFNLVYDPAVLVVAWARVRGNRGRWGFHFGAVGPGSPRVLCPAWRHAPRCGSAGPPTASKWKTHFAGNHAKSI